MSSSSKVIVGALAGIAAGIALGLLFAPDKGSETRRKIKEGYGDLSNSLKEKFDLTKDKASDLANKMKSKASSMKNDLS